MLERTLYKHFHKLSLQKSSTSFSQIKHFPIPKLKENKNPKEILTENKNPQKILTENTSTYTAGALKSFSREESKRVVDSSLTIQHKCCPVYTIWRIENRRKKVLNEEKKRIFLIWNSKVSSSIQSSPREKQRKKVYLWLVHGFL